MRKKIFKNIEWPVLICVILLIAIGIVALYSATYDTAKDELQKQILWLIISIPAIIVVTCINYEVIAKISPIFYGIFLALLVGVLFTSPVNGATSWFELGAFSFQPSEFAKIFVILTFSLVITKIQNRGGRDQISRPTRLILALTVIAVPVLLIVKQPDYGTALAFLVATVFILFTAGIKKRYIFITVLIIVISVPILYLFILPEHAKTRIDVYLNPNLDPRGAGYNIIQSKLAVGAGQLFGMGFLKGNQTQLGFLYPKTTDFIFSVIGEELGFVATAGIVILYVILITKAIYIAKTAKDDLGAYIAVGIAGIFAFHMTENIGMTIGLLPITGVPLPFVSYGGSSLLTNLIMVALLLNISGRRQKAIFMQ